LTLECSRCFFSSSSIRCSAFLRPQCVEVSTNNANQIIFSVSFAFQLNFWLPMKLTSAELNVWTTNFINLVISLIPYQGFQLSF
jgi:hypothetical protein